MLIAFWRGRRWFAPGPYSHVTLIDIRDETWVQIDVGRDRAEIVPFHSKDEVDHRLSVLTESCKILKFEPTEYAGRGYLARLSCVSFAIHYTGIRSRALFPSGLMRDLLRNGAEEIHDPEKTSRVRGIDPEPSAGSS